MQIQLLEAQKEAASLLENQGRLLEGGGIYNGQEKMRMGWMLTTEQAA